MQPVHTLMPPLFIIPTFHESTVFTSYPRSDDILGSTTLWPSRGLERIVMSTGPAALRIFAKKKARINPRGRVKRHSGGEPASLRVMTILKTLFARNDDWFGRQQDGQEELDRNPRDGHDPGYRPTDHPALEEVAPQPDLKRWIRFYDERTNRMDVADAWPKRILSPMTFRSWPCGQPTKPTACINPRSPLKIKQKLANAQQKEIC